MKCNYRKKIEKYYDRSLSEKDFAIISKHLETCTACQQYLSELEYYDHRIAHLKSLKPEMVNPDGFRNEVLSKIIPKQQNLLRNEIMREIGRAHV